VCIKQLQGLKYESGRGKEAGMALVSAAEVFQFAVLSEIKKAL